MSSKGAGRPRKHGGTTKKYTVCMGEGVFSDLKMLYMIDRRGGEYESMQDYVLAILGRHVMGRESELNEKKRLLMEYSIKMDGKKKEVESVSEGDKKLSSSLNEFNIDDEI